MLDDVRRIELRFALWLTHIVHAPRPRKPNRPDLRQHRSVRSRPSSFPPPPPRRLASRASMASSRRHSSTGRPACRPCALPAATSFVGMGRRRNLRARADLDVARRSRLPAHDDEVAKLGRTRNTGLGHDHAMPADHHVVPDLHEIINFRALADHRVLKAPRSIAVLAPISTSSWMMTRPICGTLRWPRGPMAKPNPSWPIASRRHAVITRSPIRAWVTRGAGADIAVAADGARGSRSTRRRQWACRARSGPRRRRRRRARRSTPSSSWRVGWTAAAAARLAAFGFMRIGIEELQSQREAAVGLGGHKAAMCLRARCAANAGATRQAAARVCAQLRQIFPVVEKGKIAPAPASRERSHIARSAACRDRRRAPAARRPPWRRSLQREGPARSKKPGMLHSTKTVRRAATLPIAYANAFGRALSRSGRSF